MDKSKSMIDMNARSSCKFIWIYEER